MKQKSGILNLSSKQSRNWLRGLIANPESPQTIKALKKIYSEGGEPELRAALEVLRESPLFRKGIAGRDFNTRLPKPIAPEAIDAFKPEQIFAKFKAQQTKLTSLLKICLELLVFISNNKLPEALDLARALKDRGGASIALIRYLSFIKNHSTDEEIVIECEEQLKEIGVENAKYIHNAIRELTSEKTDYLNIAEKIGNSETSAASLIAKSFIDPIPQSQATFAKTLSSYYQYSLLDAYLYAQRLNAIERGTPNQTNFVEIGEAIAINLITIDPNKLYEEKDNSIGLHAFREAFLLREIDNLFHYGLIHRFYFNSHESKEDGRTALEKQLVRDYFKSVTKIENIGAQLEQEHTKQQICLHNYTAKTACNFQNSTALIYLLDRKDGKIEGEELEFVKAMSITRDIGLIAPSHHVEQIKIHAKGDELRIVATSLSHIKQRAQLKEHELRSTIQEVALSGYQGNLLGLLEHIYEISPAVAEHLLQTMDETFLSKLFSIIPDPNQAIQERANILEWYGNKIEDNSYLERAKNLRIDVQINKARGAIDDSRIYVDPVKFTQWVSDNVLSEFTLLLESTPKQVDLQLAPIAWDKARSGLTSIEQLAALVILCYEEFCTNSIYGIASYLGRRIRHGTFKGTGFSEIRAIATANQHESLFEHREFEETFRNWSKAYEQTLDELRDRFLHINSKAKPDGLIFREFRTNSKRTIASHMLQDILKSYTANGSTVEIPYIVLEYCWRIVEEDLSAIRRLLMEKKAQNAVFRYTSTPPSINVQRELQEFSKMVNSLTAEKFRTISSWFNKPSFASPSADIVLLFKAVVSEVRSQFLQYSPRVETTEDSFVIDGGAYFVIYDALFILIYNAAENGKSDGRLSLDIQLIDKPDGKRVTITVGSELQQGEKVENIADAINTALTEDCEDALIIEGRSGIKKLKKMEQAGNVEDVHYQFEADRVLASFSFKINY